MPERETIRCPRDGAAMNCHAEKVDPGASSGADELLAVWGGALTAFYTCPRCGGIEQRRADGT